PVSPFATVQLVARLLVRLWAIQPSSRPPLKYDGDLSRMVNGMSNRWSMIALICVCQVLVLTLWVSTTAVVPSLQKERALTPFHVSLLTSSVQVGFVIGTIVSAFLGLADRLSLRHFFMAAAATGAIANILTLSVDPASLGIPVLRLVV